MDNKRVSERLLATIVNSLLVNITHAGAVDQKLPVAGPADEEALGSASAASVLVATMATARRRGRAVPALQRL